MTARSYLGQLTRLQRNIERLHEEIERQRARLTSTAIKLSADKVQTSLHGDKFADVIAAIADKDLYYHELLTIYEALRERIVCQILQMPDQRYSRLLLLKYADGKKLDEIADLIHYSPGYVKQLHGSALSAFAAQYSDDMIEI